MTVLIGKLFLLPVAIISSDIAPDCEINAIPPPSGKSRRKVAANGECLFR